MALKMFCKGIGRFREACGRAVKGIGIGSEVALRGLWTCPVWVDLKWLVGGPKILLWFLNRWVLKMGPWR